jgi:hypothetical protein
VSPSNLQSAGNGGALVVQAFDATGQPVQGATVNVQSISTSTITNTDFTNNYGVLNIIGVPQGGNAYQIIVTKPGYSTDRTYANGGAGNPNPAKPNFTVLKGQTSSAFFAIDKLSTLNFSSVSPLCTPVGNFHFTLTGAKVISKPGVTAVPKYSQNIITNAGGLFSTSSMEWDKYTITPTDSSNVIAGINPLSPFVLNPNNIQNLQLVIVPKSGNSLMVTVKDSSGLPISGATVSLTGNPSQMTGQGYISQTDWSGGSGQASSTILNKYFADNGQIDTTTSSGNILMKKIAGLYNTVPGTLESSTFDTGTTSNFYTLTWSPTGQPAPTGVNSVKFQFATNPTSTSTVWTYLGPDGTAGTYFTVPGAAINSVHNGSQFTRYKAYLSTVTATSTPSVADVSFAYTSSCIPPGQVLFQNLSGSYTLNVTKPGYTPFSGLITATSSWQEKIVNL